MAEGYMGVPSRIAEHFPEGKKPFWNQEARDKVAAMIPKRTEPIVEHDANEPEYNPNAVGLTLDHSSDKVIECPRDINCSGCSAVSPERRKVFLDLVVNNANLGD